MNNNQLQVILTGVFSDGHLVKPLSGMSNSSYTTNSINKEYLEYKKLLLGDNLSLEISEKENNGYKKEARIFTLASRASVGITEIYYDSLENNLNKIDELGIALWFYDDGSLHQNKHFYNLNTHSFPRQIQEELFIPFFRRFGIECKLTHENKKDGRKFYYLRISRHEGAFEISRLLRKYYVKCFDYKIWSSETIHLWSKLQEQLKSENKTLSRASFSKTIEQMRYITMSFKEESKKISFIRYSPTSAEIAENQYGFDIGVTKLELVWKYKGKYSDDIRRIMADTATLYLEGFTVMKAEAQVGTSWLK